MNYTGQKIINKLYTSLCFFFLSSTTFIYAKDFPIEFYEKILSQYDILSALEYKSQRTITFNSSVFKKEEIDAYAFPRGSITAKIGYNYFFYDIDFIFSKTPNSKSMLVALNESGYQELKKNSEVLYISKKPTREFDFLVYAEDMFLPISFALFERIDNPLYSITKISDIQTKVRKAGLKKKLKFVGETQDYVSGTLVGGVDIGTQKRLTYTIKFSKINDYFPTQWESLDENSKVVYSYKVLDLGTVKFLGQKFCYPKLAEYKYHGGMDSIAIIPEGRTTTVISINSVVINNPKLIKELSSFEIDPSIVKTIVDTDKQIRVNVPK